MYTAEEKAALAMVTFEQNRQKEAKVVEDLKKLVSRTLGQQADIRGGFAAGGSEGGGAGGAGGAGA